jgi:hypothetical protein
MATSSGPGAGSWDSPTRPDNSPLTAHRLPGRETWFQSQLATNIEAEAAVFWHLIRRLREPSFQPPFDGLK